MSEKRSKKHASVGAVVGVFWSHAKRYPGALFFVLLGMAMLQAATLTAPLYLRLFFNTLVTGTRGASTAHTLIGLLVVIGGIYLLEWLARRVQTWAVIYITSRVTVDLFSSAFAYLIDHSYNFFSSSFSGSLTHKITKYARAYDALFDSITYQFVPTFLFVAGAVTILYLHNHTLGIALGLWAIAFVWFQIFIARLRQPIRTARAEADTKITATLADAISNQAAISLFSGSTFERGMLASVVDDWRVKTLRAWYTDDWTWAGIGLFMVAIEIGLLFGAVHYWEIGMLTIGDFVLIQAYLLTTFDRLVGINRELRRFFDVFADASEMVEILQRPHEVEDAPAAKALQIGEGKIAFTDVSFYFHTEKGVFHDFNLVIPGGQKVALVGPSGAGKSTITKLLLRLFDVKQGAIEIDGQNISAVTQESLRNAISFVPQEPVLFHRTLMENIRYGRRDATDEEVIDAARKAHCDEFISALPDRYETYVGERGVKLSGGERQRVAIARAILKNAPILVLDEATSSLDSQSEALIQDALRVLMEGKTVIVIAHRLSTIMKMDRIVVIDRGEIVSDGTHQELLEHEGLYKKLWSVQAGGFIADDAE
jgi:ATP-binding cassette subfamily B protein